MSCTRAWLISTCGISEMPSGTSCTRATRVSGSLPPGAQKVVSLIHTDSRATFSPKPKAWNISIERTLMPSAWPFLHGPELGLDQQGADLRHARQLRGQAQAGGPEPAISTSTVCGGVAGAAAAGAAGRTSGSPGWKPLGGIACWSSRCRPVTIRMHMVSIHTKTVKRRDPTEMAGHLIRRLHQQSTQVFRRARRPPASISPRCSSRRSTASSDSPASTRPAWPRPSASTAPPSAA